VSHNVWVINASPLILLGKLGRTDLLESGSYLAGDLVRQALAKVGE